MVNVRGERAKQRVRAQMERRWVVFQKVFMKSIRTILKKQYQTAAEHVASYNLDFNYAIIKYNPELRNLFRRHYKRVLTAFGEGSLKELEKIKGFENYETKGFVEDFWRFATPWLNQTAANQVVAVTNTTRAMIAGIVKREMLADHTNEEIAKQILDIGEIATMFRAERIARTETHSAANYATDQAMVESRLMKEKEWVSCLDERTRTPDAGAEFDHVAANGERVAIDDSFKETGENLDYPGDMSNGSPGNIINCRCVSLFHTDVKVSGGEG